MTQTESKNDPYKYPLKDPFIDPYRDPSLKSQTASEIFEKYFLAMPTRKAEKIERDAWDKVKRQKFFASDEEHLECFRSVSAQKDKQGKSIAMKFVWMSNGLTEILAKARKRIRSRNRQEEERLQAEKKAQEEVNLAQQTSPEDVRLAKQAIRALLSTGPLKSFGPLQPQPQSSPELHRRQDFLLAQAKQIQQIETFGRL